MKQIIRWQAALLILTMSLATTASAQDRFDGVSIETVPVSDNIYVLVGQGGNIGVLAGDEGLLMVDAQYAGLADRIRLALTDLGDPDPRFLINTHFHDDHTNGNPEFGRDSVIIAHENVRTRLRDAGMAPEGLPQLTFEDRMTLNFNGEHIELVHYPRGHTDGDIVIYFMDANVVHMGDLFFHDRFPFIDLGAGGDVQGHMDNVTAALERIDDDTLVIPGHGQAVSNKAELTEFRDMIHATSAVVRSMKSEGMSKEEIVEQGLDARWSDWSWGFISEARWIETIYDSYPE